ncbi:glutathione S-transferase-like [Rhodnius prolixus]|uniref:glutathione S-transferase-like n=1 Tax=Rhodnius prolixus TaxID=13249 RepID=UPI003D18C27E
MAEEPKYKLMYFNARGKAEHIRFIFAYAGVDYTDYRIPKEKWPDMKKTMPFGVVPVLEIEGVGLVGQSNAIARYLAQRYGLAGKDPHEALQCDALVDTLADLKQVLWQYRTEDDPIKKEERKANLMKEVIPYYLKRFERIVKENNGFAVGESVTWADFAFAVSLENFELIFGNGSLEPYPNLRALKNMVFSLPNIKAWLERRPKTEF